MAQLDDGGTRLRSGVSLWQALNGEAPPQTQPQPGALRKADIVIVGAGITGAFLAERFSREGKSVVVIDRREPLTGSTTASTAMLLWELDTPLIELEDKLGFAAANSIVQQNHRTVGRIGRLVEDLRIACGYQPRSSLFLAGSELDAADLREERRIRRHAGIEGDYLDRDRLAAEGLDANAALLYPGSANVDPLALAHGLLRAASERGAVILSPATASDYETGPSGAVVHTREGEVVSARHLILANGYEMPDFVRTPVHRVVSTWALASQPRALQAGLLHSALVWEAADPYIYLRPAADGRIIAGGEDEDIDDPAQRDALSQAKTQAIERKIEARCPGLGPIDAEFSWTGFFGRTEDGLPLIGPVPGSPHCHAAFGYGGNGITSSAIAADTLSAMIDGRDTPNLPAYALDRT
jgi:glycine/D-amino acid oxidase-like deaminating enzyme